MAAAIAVGGLVGARRVAETMSHKVTAMSTGQGLSASLATGSLVLAASLVGLPVCDHTFWSAPSSASAR